jgi:CheY-like chemotaxis protein
LCILVVEDEPIILMAAADGLKEVGYKVMEAEHAPRAVELLEQWPQYFTMLVTDHNLPPYAMTGADLVRHMRGEYPAIPMVIATATQQVIIEAFRREYRVHMLPKPYDTATLTGVVGRLLGPPSAP